MTDLEYFLAEGCDNDQEAYKFEALVLEEINYLDDQIIKLQLMVNDLNEDLSNAHQTRSDFFKRVREILPSF